MDLTAYGWMLTTLALIFIFIFGMPFLGIVCILGSGTLFAISLGKIDDDTIQYVKQIGNIVLQQKIEQFKENPMVKELINASVIERDRRKIN